MFADGDDSASLIVIEPVRQTAVRITLPKPLHSIPEGVNLFELDFSPLLVGPNRIDMLYLFIYQLSALTGRA